MPTINARFVQLRNVLNMTQEGFASGAHRTRSEIKNIEYEKTAPKEEVIQSVCSAYNVNENWLRTGEGDMFRPISRDEEIADFIGAIMYAEDDNFQKRLINVLRQLDSAEWKLLEKMAMKLAAEYGKEDQA